MAEIEAPQSVRSWFLEAVRFDIDTLVISLSTTTGRAVEVVFAPPREFRCFAESDAWQYLRDFNGREIVGCSDRGCGIVVSETSPYLRDYQVRVRLQDPETTFAYLIKTPQECVEVISFEDPEVRWL